MITYDLPLFPLNTVLFPGIPLRLHIFEDRYKQMVQACLQTSQPFGVVLIRSGNEALGPLAEPYPIGCIAQIMRIQELSEGRYNLLVIGRERFRILSRDDSSRPYMMGTVVAFPLQTNPGEDLGRITEQLRSFLRHYLEVWSEAGHHPMDPDVIPENPVELAYLAASMVQIPLDEKQELLSVENTLDLLVQLEKVYRRELALSRVISSFHGQFPGTFSVN